MTIDEAKEALGATQQELNQLPARREQLIRQVGYLNGFIDSQEDPDKATLIRPEAPPPQE